jgi:hypothetical protein
MQASQADVFAIRPICYADYRAGLIAARDVNNERVGRLRYRDGDARQASFK